MRHDLAADSLNERVRTLKCGQHEPKLLDIDNDDGDDNDNDNGNDNNNDNENDEILFYVLTANNCTSMLVFKVTSKYIEHTNQMNCNGKCLN